MDLGDLLRSLSTNRGAVSTLVVLLIGLVALLVFAPGATAALSARTGTDSLVGRMLGQLRLLSISDRPFAERVTRLAYRDGKPEGDLEINSDFLLFTRLSLGLVLGAVGVLLAIVTGFPLLVIAGPLGFIGPVLYAIIYNRNRRAKIALEVPPVLRQLETRVSAGLELRDAFARIAAGRSGGLYAELGWAAAQMANPAVRSYEVLRALDARTGLRLFGPLADAMERASRRGRRDELDVFLAYIGRLIADDEARRDTVIAGIGNKVILGMFPFLLAGLIASVIGPLVFTLGS